MTTEKRKNLTKNEKLQVLQQRPFCFICEKPISAGDLPELNFDHIKSLDAGGTNDLNNFAGAHKICHSPKGIKSLEEYKEEIRLNKEFGELFRFTDVTEKLNPKKELMQFIIDDKKEKITFQEGGEAIIYKDPNTSLSYFYHRIPQKYLESDVEVQPRGLEQKRLRDLTMNLRQNFQLSPTVCRLISNEKRILVFDGQHKATAQAIGNQNSDIDCKVYILTRLFKW